MVLIHLVWVAIRACQEEPCSRPGFLTPFPHRSFSASAELAQQILARLTVQKMGKLSPFFPISLPPMDLAQTSSPPARAGSREKRFGKAKPFMVASALPALLFIQTTHTRWKRTMQVKYIGLRYGSLVLRRLVRQKELFINGRGLDIGFRRILDVFFSQESRGLFFALLSGFKKLIPRRDYFLVLDILP